MTKTVSVRRKGAVDRLVHVGRDLTRDIEGGALRPHGVGEAHGGRSGSGQSVRVGGEHSDVCPGVRRVGPTKADEHLGGQHTRLPLELGHPIQQRTHRFHVGHRLLARQEQR